MRELTLPGRLILLPGFCADDRMFAPQRCAFGDALETPDWIAPENKQSIDAYAQRMAKRLSRPGDDRPLFIGGVSLGGVVALEMAKYIEPKPRAVLMIASTTRGENWSLPLQLVELMGRAIPQSSVVKVSQLLSVLFALRDGADDHCKSLLWKMAKDADPAFLKWAGGAAMDWPGAEGDSDTPVYRIHGSNDWMVPDASGADEVVEHGRHLINFSHAATVNRFLFDHMLAHVPEAMPDVPEPRVEDPHLTVQRRLAMEGAPVGTPLV